MATPLTKRDAARRLGVSVRTIERRIKAGELPTSVVHGPHGHLFLRPALAVPPAS